MRREITVKIFSIEQDGFPTESEQAGGFGVNPEYVNRVGFLHNGSIYSGWALSKNESARLGADDDERYWEANEDLVTRKFAGVTHWLYFPEPFSKLPNAGAFND